MHTVTLSQNNSGGSFWLKDADFDALVADGWVESDPSLSVGMWGRVAGDLTLDVPVEAEAAAITIAKIEFQRVTGQDPDDEGCNCCGPPFDFSCGW